MNNSQATMQQLMTHMEKSYSNYWTGLTSAISNSAKWLESAGGGTAKQLAALGEQLTDLAATQAKDFMKLAEGVGTPIERAAFREMAFDMTQRIDSIRQAGFDAYKEYGEVVAKVAKQRTWRLAAGHAGVALDYFNVIRAAKESHKTGDWDILGEAAAGVVAATFLSTIAAVAAKAGMVALGFAGGPVVAAMFIAVGVAGYYGSASGKETFSLFKRSITFISDLLGLSPDPLVKTIQYVDPLVLDLDGDGYEITKLSEGILFDANGNTIKNGTAWVGRDDGLLVWDRNGNGLIDSGRELFGDETLLADGTKAAHGFAALSELDTGSEANPDGASDGVFDAKDARFNEIRVWRDLNQDGVSQSGELTSLTDLGIASINLRSTRTNVDHGDAKLVEGGTYTRADGSTGKAGSFVLAQNGFKREFKRIAVSDDAAALPEITGSGWVRDLREAATLNPKLIAMIKDLESMTDRDRWRDAIGELVKEWSSTSEYASASDRAIADGYALILSEPENDEERSWMKVAVKGSEAERNAFRAKLDSAAVERFDAMRERMVGGLEKIYAYEKFTGYTFLDWKQIKGDASNYAPRFVTQRTGVAVEAWTPLSQLIFQNRNELESDEDGFIRLTIPNQPDGVSHFDSLWNRLVDDAATNMVALRLDKYLALVDLTADGKSLTLDTSRMDKALADAMAVDARNGAALILEIYQAQGKVLVPAGWNGVAQMADLAQRALVDPAIRKSFADAKMNYITGGASTTADGDAYRSNTVGNSFSGTAGSDVLVGNAGNDTLNGGAGNDMLIGSAGDDTLSGGDGDDIIDGGIGNDTLYGGAGADVFRFGTGYGHDYVGSSDNASARLDTVELANINVSDVIVGRQGDTLVLAHTNGKDMLRVYRYFTESGTVSTVKVLKFADGTTWNVATTLSKVTAIFGDEYGNSLKWDRDSEGTVFGLGGNDGITGGSKNDVIDGGDGHDTLYGYGGDDTLIGGAGNDTLYGGDGADLIDGGSGNDTLYGGAGADVFRFGTGYGQDRIRSADVASARLDTVEFRDINAVDLDMRRVGDALILTHTNGKDVLTIEDYFSRSSDVSTVKELKFADGAIWDTAAVSRTIITYGNNYQNSIVGLQDFAGTFYGYGDNDAIYGGSKSDVIDGGDGHDTLYGRDGNDTLIGGDGYDTLYGEAGDDTLIGGAGNDTLYGGDGADILDGGAGNDTLYGGDGADVFRFGTGYAKDRIRSINNASARLDTVELT
ncbi:calcium-binding protein, partial [Cupriavidus sp. DL-D2]|uniref:calcium-binding protein n=1 Tax=Cupriavidus sp. DL-D2 TaxID=3144974 RepID=UPI003215D6D1